MFKIGDVVVCVDVSEFEGARCLHTGQNVKKGSTHKVTGFVVEKCGCLALTLGSVNGLPFRFKHLPKADDAFINQMRSLKPAKEKTRVR